MSAVGEPQPNLAQVAALREQMARDGFVDLRTTVALPVTLGCIALGVAVLLAVSPPRQGPPAPATLIGTALVGVALLALVPAARRPVRVDGLGLHVRYPWRYDLPWSVVTSVDLWQPSTGFGPRWVLASADPGRLEAPRDTWWWPRLMYKFSRAFGVAGFALPRFRLGNATVVAFLAAETAARRRQ